MVVSNSLDINHEIVKRSVRSVVCRQLTACVQVSYAVADAPLNFIRRHIIQRLPNGLVEAQVRCLEHSLELDFLEKLLGDVPHVLDAVELGVVRDVSYDVES